MTSRLVANKPLKDRSKEWKQVYLVLSLEADMETHRLRVCETVTEAIEGWEASTRISPIFVPATFRPSKDGAALFRGARHFILLGPVSPRVIRPRIGGGALWLTLGAFNVLVNCPSKAVADQLRTWASAQGLRGEHWHTLRGKIQRVQYFGPTPPMSTWRDTLRGIRVTSADSEYAEAVQEYMPLMASGAARCERALPDLLPGLIEINRGVASKLRAPLSAADTPHERLAMLTTLNAGLSRFTSQAFSGTSPIRETECHFWTHSLFGTAVANLALSRFASFIMSVFTDARVAQRIAAIDRLGNGPSEYCFNTISEDNDFWFTDHLQRVNLTDVEQHASTVPLIAHFSGRDGFKSTLYTISAPLAVIGSCNSMRWTLMTLTHELTHTLMRGVLSEIMPWGADNSYQDALDVFLGRAPKTWLNAIRRHVLVAAFAMDTAERTVLASAAGPLTPVAIRKIIERWRDEMTEILVHTFDFLYFYGQDAEKYASGIWLSWTAMPTTESKVQEYVQRTLCALLTKHLRRANGMDVARNELLEIFAKMPRAGAGSGFIAHAEAYLQQDWDRIRTRLAGRLALVQLTRAFLYSEEVATQLGRETQLTSDASSHNGYGLQVGDFERANVDNPLKFLDAYTKGTSADAVQSLWLLYVLAFHQPMRGDAQERAASSRVGQTPTKPVSTPGAPRATTPTTRAPAEPTRPARKKPRRGRP